MKALEQPRSNMGHPTRPDELDLLNAFKHEPTERYGGRSIWVIAQDLGIPYKRARYIVRDKWARKGWVEYGVSWRRAWLVDR